jgi:hypothetical protein
MLIVVQISLNLYGTGFFTKKNIRTKENNLKLILISIKKNYFKINLNIIFKCLN